MKSGKHAKHVKLASSASLVSDSILRSAYRLAARSAKPQIMSFAATNHGADPASVASWLEAGKAPSGLAAVWTWMRDKLGYEPLVPDRLTNKLRHGITSILGFSGGHISSERVQNWEIVEPALGSRFSAMAAYQPLIHLLQEGALKATRLTLLTQRGISFSKARKYLLSFQAKDGTHGVAMLTVHPRVRQEPEILRALGIDLTGKCIVSSLHQRLVPCHDARLLSRAQMKAIPTAAPVAVLKAIEIKRHVEEGATRDLTAIMRARGMDVAKTNELIAAKLERGELNPEAEPTLVAVDPEDFEVRRHRLR